MRLNIVNEFAIETDNGVIRRLRTRKTEEMLTFLALHQSRWISRSELMDVLWPEDDEHTGRQKIRLALHSIRSVIQDHLDTDGDLVKITGLDVDFESANLASLAPGWRLMPGHQIDWLDQLAVMREARQQFTALSSLEGTIGERTANLSYLLSLDPGEPSLYSQLHAAYQEQGSRAAARIVAGFARLNLGRNCPAELTESNSTIIRSDFVGRLRELSNLADSLLGGNEPAAVQLNGIGGMGKSRLAVELAPYAAGEEIPWVLVSLAGARDGKIAENLFVSAIADRLFLDESEARIPSEISSVLVILDEADMLDQNALSFLEPYLQSGSGLRVLVTCQARRPEIPLATLVQPVSLPRGNTLEQIQNSEAVSLLTYYSSKPVSDENWRDYKILAEESGGVPLALTMIGSEARYRPLSDLSQSLRGKSVELKFGRGKSTKQERHHSLEATLRWSFAILSSANQNCICKLAALEATFDRTVLPHLKINEENFTQLIESNWISAGPTEQWFCLLPPIKAFLRTIDSKLIVRSREIVKKFLVGEIGTHYPENYPQVCALAKCYQADFDAMERESGRDAYEIQGALLIGLQPTAHYYGRVERSLSRMEEVLSKVENPQLRVLLANTEYLRRNFGAALQHFELVATDDVELQSVVSSNIGLIELSTGHPDKALPLLLGSVEQTALPRRKGARLVNLCSCYSMLGEYSSALEKAAAAMEIFTRIEGAEGYRGLCHLRRAEVEFLSGQIEVGKTSALLALDEFEIAKEWHHMVDLYILLILIAARAGSQKEVTRWGMLLLDQHPDTVSLCGTLFAALTSIQQHSEAAQFGRGIVPLELPLLLKCLKIDPAFEPKFHPRSYWYALSRQTLKHL